jgi:hypothetical protein
VVSGAQVNYARQVLRHVQPAHAAGMPAVIADNEQGQVSELSWPELQRQVAALALHLRAQGVGKGDRVAAYLPNVPEAIVALLAVASLGAVWSVCAPDMGTAAVLDRFQQIEPKALIAVDGVYYAGKPLDRSAVLQELRAQLPTLRMWWCCAARMRPRWWPTAPIWPRCWPATMRPPLLSSPNGCRSTTRCGSSIPAAPPACPSPSSTAMAAWCWWRCASRPCTTTWAAATTPTAGASASTGTAPPAG